MQDVEVSRRYTPEVTADPIFGSAAAHDAVWAHHALLAFFTFLWGSNFVLAEVALLEMSPVSFSVTRFVMGGIGMVGLYYWECRRYIPHRRLLAFPTLSIPEWRRLLLVSLCGATLAPWLGIEGLNLTHAGRAAFWLALAPAVSAALGALLGTERLGRVGRVGLILAGLGTLGMALDNITAQHDYWLGDVLLFAALVLAVTELHLIKPLALRHGATPIVMARTIVGGLIYIAVALPSIVRQPWLDLSVWTWVAIVVGGTVGVGIGQWAKVRALRVIGPTQVVIYGNLVPLATLLIGWLVLGTLTTTTELMAGLLIVIGAYCMQRGGASVLEREPAVG